MKDTRMIIIIVFNSLPAIESKHSSSLLSLFSRITEKTNLFQ